MKFYVNIQALLTAKLETKILDHSMLAALGAGFRWKHRMNMELRTTYAYGILSISLCSNSFLGHFIQLNLDLLIKSIDT